MKVCSSEAQFWWAPTAGPKYSARLCVITRALERAFRPPPPFDNSINCINKRAFHFYIINDTNRKRSEVF